MDINCKALLDGMSAQLQRERAENQVTLGELIELLEAMDPAEIVAGLRGAHSYRGYYEDLAFEYEYGGMRDAGGLLKECRAAMGRVFNGYKGGDYVMGEKTNVWVARYGNLGEKLMALLPGGEIKTAYDE